MAFVMQPGRQKGSAGDVPDVSNLDNGSITCNKGRVVTNTAGSAVLHALASTVTNVYGVSLEKCTSGTSEGPASTLLAIAKADRNTEFVAGVVESGAVVTGTMPAFVIGSEYGLITVSSQDYVDFDDTSNKLAQITKIDTDLKIVWFLFIESTLQEA